MIVFIKESLIRYLYFSGKFLIRTSFHSLYNFLLILLSFIDSGISICFQQNPASSKNLLTLSSLIVFAKVSFLCLTCSHSSSHNFQSCLCAYRIERSCSSLSSRSSFVACLYCLHISFLSSSSFADLFSSFISLRILSENLLFSIAWFPILSHSSISWDFQPK